MAIATGTISIAALGNTSGQIDLAFAGYGGTGRANTVYIWGSFAGAAVALQCRPTTPNDDGSYEWFPVKTIQGLPAVWTDPSTDKVQPHGAFSFIGRSGGYQLTYSGLQPATIVKFEVR